jgi:hypothetical protein
MSTVQSIIEKAKSDKNFAYLIKNDPEKALAPYKLSTVELKKVVEEVKQILLRDDSFRVPPPG